MRITKLIPEYVDFIPPVEAMKEGVLYISKAFKSTAHLCACGCGNVVVCRMAVVTECFGR